MSQLEFRPGLADVPCAESAISFIDGKRARLEYRGIAVETLARESCFEETAWLLLKGELPTQRELALRRQVALEEQPGRFLKAAFASQRLDRDAAIFQSGAFAIDEADRRLRYRHVRQTWPEFRLAHSALFGEW